MDENYSNVIGSLSTDELKDIYLYRFLEYNEDFVSSCYIELTQNRGVTPDQLDTEIKKLPLIICIMLFVISDYRVRQKAKSKDTWNIIEYMITMKY